MIVAIVVGLGVAGGLLYAFGAMWPPSAETRTAYAAEVAAGREPALPSRFTVPVPGCVCHSDDPVLQMQHASRRISECGGCHGQR